MLYSCLLHRSVLMQIDHLYVISCRLFFKMGLSLEEVITGWKKLSATCQWPAACSTSHTRADFFRFV